MFTQEEPPIPSADSNQSFLEAYRPESLFRRMLPELDFIKEGTTLNKLASLVRDAILLLIFLGLAAKETHLLALAFLAPLAAPALFIALGVFELISAITVFRTVWTDRKRMLGIDCGFSVLQILSPLAAAVGCSLVALSAYLGLAFSAFIVPALFALAFVGGTASAGKGIYDAFKNKQSKLDKALAVLNFGCNLAGLAAVVFALLLPAIPGAALIGSPMIIAGLLITAGAFRIVPMLKGVKAWYESANSSKEWWSSRVPEDGQKNSPPVVQIGSRWREFGIEMRNKLPEVVSTGDFSKIGQNRGPSLSS